jgi:thiol-disulfide isomerase/thioredoxin
VAFTGPDGLRTTVGAFKGKTILLNLWATWCIPCREEMPALAKLQTALGSPDFAVIAVNIDTTRLEKPPAFLREIGATALPYYADHTADILQQLKQSDKIQGLPTTLLIGRDGCEIGKMEGPAVWDSPDAQNLIKQVAGT